MPVLNIELVCFIHCRIFCGVGSLESKARDGIVRSLSWAVGSLVRICLAGSRGLVS